MSQDQDGFTISRLNTRHPDITIELRHPQKSQWAIVKYGATMNRDFEFEHEPQPSSRTEDFFKRCRFDSMEEAILYFNRYMKDILGR